MDHHIDINLFDEEAVIDLALFFKIFGDVTRLKILFSLLNGEFTVTDLIGKLGISQSTISHQIGLLRRMNLVKSRREGKSIFYSLDDEHINSILLQGFTHISEKGKNQ